MDQGLASALFTLAVGFPIVASFLLFGPASGGLFAGVLVVGLAATMLVASRFDQPDREGEAVGGDAAASESEAGALHELRGRYARGELSEEQFERKVETLLETETPEDARKRVASDADERGERKAEPERTTTR